MPRETFFNLPEEKRNKITDAAFKVLSEHPYAEASINMIIKEAEIPRGSFYQYFDDKDDLIRYMFAGIRHSMGTYIAERIKQDLENIDELIIQVFDIFISFGSDEKRIKVFTNAFSNPEMVGMFLEDTSRDMKLLVEEIKKHLDKDFFGLDTEEEIDIIIELGISAFKDSICECFTDMSRKEQVIRKFKIKLDIISKGAAAIGGNR